MYGTIIHDYYQITTDEKQYPCPGIADPDRKVTVQKDDVLQRTRNGTFINHSRNGITGIVIPQADLRHYRQSIFLKKNTRANKT